MFNRFVAFFFLKFEVIEICDIYRNYGILCLSNSCSAIIIIRYIEI